MRILSPVFELVETNFEYSVELQKYQRQHKVFQQQVEVGQRIDIVLEASKQNLLEELSKW